MSWHVFSASVAGTGKRESAQPAQDASAHRVRGDQLVAVVCDGAGSAALSHLGASFAARRVAQELIDCTASTAEGALAIEAAVMRAREALEQHCLQTGALLADFATTMVGVIADANGGWLFHVGDGVAAARPRGDGDAVVSRPENGEYSNETFFVTDEEWRDHLRITRVPVSLRSVILMSDGVQPFAMTRGCGAPFEPFVGPIERFLQSVPAEAGDAALAELLTDPRLDAITSDDKTLLIAQWRTP